MNHEQLEWLAEELQKCEASDQKAVVFLHCYPSDLKAGGQRLADLLHRYPVLLVDMGHTHYNEISNDGQVLYSATRSTGQIEEGPVGYSVITLDGNCVSWHFVPLGSPSLVNIARPADDRLFTSRTDSTDKPEAIVVHAKIWSASPITNVRTQFAEEFAELHSEDGTLWTGSIDATYLREGTGDLHVVAKQASGDQITSSIRVTLGKRPDRSFHAIDQDNAIGEWQERGLLGTQLGPNKHGKKW